MDKTKKNKTHQSTVVAVDVCRASCGGRMSRALVVGLSRASSAGLLPSRSRTSSAIVVCVADARAVVRRAGDCCWSCR